MAACTVYQHLPNQQHACAARLARHSHHQLEPPSTSDSAGQARRPRRDPRPSRRVCGRRRRAQLASTSSCPHHARPARLARPAHDRTNSPLESLTPTRARRTRCRPASQLPAVNLMGRRCHLRGLRPPPACPAGHQIVPAPRARSTHLQAEHFDLGRCRPGWSAAVRLHLVGRRHLQAPQPSPYAQVASSSPRQRHALGPARPSPT